MILRRNHADEFAKMIEAAKQGDYSSVPKDFRETERTYGALPEDLSLVHKFAASNGLKVTAEKPASRSLTLEGSVTQINRTFGITLYDHRFGAHVTRAHFGEIRVPRELHDVVRYVAGLSDTLRVRPRQQGPSNDDSAPSVATFSPPQVAQFYHFPAGTDGAGQCIALFEVAGGYVSSDLNAYFASLNLKIPQITEVDVDGGKNAPGGPGDQEVDEDLKIAGAIAPGAELVVYFTDNTSQGFIDGLQEVVHGSHHCSTLSISWGAPETTWDAASRTQIDEVFQDAIAAHMSVFTSSGDNGSRDGTITDVVDFPSASPNVTACGGTDWSLKNGALLTESVWGTDPNASGRSGGGISTVFPVPAYQQGLSAPLKSGGSTPLKFRGVPDVSGYAGFYLLYPNSDINSWPGATSAVPPLYAALFTLINALRGEPVGFANAVLYANPDAFNIVSGGNNGTYIAGKGWSAATGLGTPNGLAIQALFKN